MADGETGNKRHKAGEAVFGSGITDLVLKNFYCLYLLFFPPFSPVLPVLNF
jgi:hypothetical protein